MINEFQDFYDNSDNGYLSEKMKKKHINGHKIKILKILGIHPY